MSLRLVPLIDGPEHDETIVFVQGWPNDASVWDSTVDALRRNYRCIRITLPNFDGKPVARWGYSTEEIVDAIADLLREVGTSRPVTLVLHDWGTYWGHAAHHRCPELAKPTGDGLSRILAFKTPSGVSISDDEAARELHHFVIAGRVVYAHLLTVVMALARHPEVRQRLQSEVERDLPDGTLSVEKLLAMKYLTEVLMEVKRTSPVVPGMFGRAKADIALGGFVIPRGWTVMFGLRESLVDGSTFVDPDRFDPERFEGPRNEDKRHEHALVPHGPGQPETSHHCAGTDYASQLTKIFMVTLVRRYRMELPEQRLDYEWSQLTPDPKDGLRARVVKM